MGDAPSRSPMITQACWKLAEILSRILDSYKRLAVRGDLEESGETGLQAWPLPLVFYTAILPLILQTTLIFRPSLWGMHQGPQPPSRLLQAILWVVAVVVAPSVGSLFWWPFHGSWQMRLLLLAAYWPVGYLAVTEIGRRWHHRIGSI